MSTFKCTECSTTFSEEVNGIVCCPECGKVLPLPNDLTEDQLEKVYNEAILASSRARLSSNLEELVAVFEQLGDYQDSEYQAERCRKILADAKKDEKFALATSKMEEETIRSCRMAIELFEELGEWKGASFKAEECKVKLNNLLVKREQRRDFVAKISMITCAAILILSLLAWAVIQFLVPAIRYSWALSRIEKEQYDKGYAILEDLGDYREAKKELKKSKYNRAVAYEAEENYLLACDFYDQARGYNDADSRLYNVCKKLTLKQQLSVLEVGSSVLFGVYEQDSATEGKESIEWIIIDRVGDEALIVSKKALEGTPYSKTFAPWGKSELCVWLNSSFYSGSFATKDRAYILQKKISTVYKDDQGAEQIDLADNFIFLLSDKDARKYFTSPDQRCAEATKSLVARNNTIPPAMPINSGNGCAHYWLRTTAPGGNVMYVNGSGGINEDGKLGEYIMGIRPAMWVSAEQ